MGAFSEYLASLKRELAGGAATENTYRPALKALLESSEPGISATNEPKRTQCGAPDFSIKRKGVLLGYVETKDIGTTLEEMERGKVPYGDQFNRYREGLPNWVLTDYLDFHWWVNGKKRLTVRGSIAGREICCPTRPLTRRKNATSCETIPPHSRPTRPTRIGAAREKLDEKG